MSTTALFFSFFFQAEDGIRDTSVTGVQTCALPIYSVPRFFGLDCYSGIGGASSCRSEEHTSELQSPMYLVCRLLLEKKKIILVGIVCGIRSGHTPVLMFSLHFV